MHLEWKGGQRPLSGRERTEADFQTDLPSTSRAQLKLPWPECLASQALFLMDAEAKSSPRGTPATAQQGIIHPLGSLGQDLSVLAEDLFKLIRWRAIKPRLKAKGVGWQREEKEIIPS